MQPLNLPTYTFRLKEEQGKQQIYDPFRKKFIVLTPEEWVRQHFLQYLVNHKKFPASLIIVEAATTINSLKKRADILVYNNQGAPQWIVECKAPEVKITQATLDQAARYNMVFKVKYIIITNGLQHFCCEMDYETNSYRFLETIPDYN